MAPSSSPSKATFLSTMLFLMLLVQQTTAAASDSAMSFLDSGDGIKIGGAVLAVLAIIVGAVMCFAGYRFFRYAIFVCGFIIGGIVIASIAEALFKNKSYMVTVSWIAFIVGGIIVGILAMYFYRLSIFIAGATAGVLLAFLIQTSFGYKISESNPNVVLIILAVILAIVGGILALKFERLIIILATAFIGAVSLVWGVGYFAGDFPNAAALGQDDVPTAWWVYLLCIVLLTALGAMVQFRKTSIGHNHHTHHKHHALTTNAIPSSSYSGAQTPPAREEAMNSPV